VYSLRLHCTSDRAEEISLRLWELGTIAISETYEGNAYVLTAGFEDESSRDSVLREFGRYAPEWREDRTDWEAVARDAWPGRAIGRSLYLAPPWLGEPTPEGRLRLIQNPGQASGTGEHPCTQLALEALEQTVFPGCKVLDVGTGSAILAIAAVKLGASTALGIDPDELVLQTAKENFALNRLSPLLAVGSADAIGDGWADVTVANISATVLVSLADELLRATKPTGILILTGFPRSEAAALTEFLRKSELTCLEEWACLTAKLSLSASLSRRL
jgi:ribosomal protein L11 methyltransferase